MQQVSLDLTFDPHPHICRLRHYARIYIIYSMKYDKVKLNILPYLFLLLISLNVNLTFVAQDIYSGEIILVTFSYNYLHNTV
jgi:hypothetical protein